MGYQNRAWTEEKVERLLKQGRGSGIGKDYRPFIEITDLSSIGLSRRTFSTKTGRVHHLLSDVEWHFFLMLQWSTDIIDIREQFPLDREITRDVAMSLGIAHPCYPGTHTPTVMTVDFLVTRIRNSVKVLEAYDIKRTEAAEDIRTLDKLEISRETCSLLGTAHHLIYHSMLPLKKIKNIEWILGGQYVEGEKEPYTGYIEEHCSRLLAAMTTATKKSILSVFCSQYDERCGLQSGSALRFARMLMHERALIAPLESNDLAATAMSEFIVVARSGQLRAVGGM